jgi:23S rRNA (uracil1939-C5)-methyltransferase
VPGGDGLARLRDGRIGFVPGGLPQDRIQPVRMEDHQSYLLALSWDLVTASPERVEPLCPVADTCGGCDWMHLERSAQLREKAALLGQALTRTGGFDPLPSDFAVTSHGPTERYRNRLRLHVDTHGRIGLYARRSHELCAIDDCLVGPVATRDVLEVARELSRKHSESLAAFAELELRTAPAGPPMVLALRPRELARPLPEPSVRLLEALSQRYVVSVMGHPEPALPRQHWPLWEGVDLEVAPHAFVQVNWPVNVELVRRVVEGARQRGAQSFLDLFCGAGNFTLPLLSTGLGGVAVDRDPHGVASAQRAAQEAGWSRATFIASDVRSALRGLGDRGQRFDLLVLDPPRSGALGLLDAVPALKPRHVAMCACDPVTLARDLKRLVDLGFEVEELSGLDMFPHTHHFEVLSWLRGPPP